MFFIKTIIYSFGVDIQYDVSSVTIVRSLLCYSLAICSLCLHDSNNMLFYSSSSVDHDADCWLKSGLKNCKSVSNFIGG